MALLCWVAGGSVPGGRLDDGGAGVGVGAGVGAGGGVATSACFTGVGAVVSLTCGVSEGRPRNHHAPPPPRSSSTAAAAAIGTSGMPRDGAGGAAAGTTRAGCGAGAGGTGAATIVASSSLTIGSGGAVAATRIASANAVAEANRSSGRFAIARRTTASNAGGAVTEICDGAGGSVFSALCMIADMPPSNGRSPVSN